MMAGQTRPARNDAYWPSRISAIEDMARDTFFVKPHVTTPGGVVAGGTLNGLFWRTLTGLLLFPRLRARVPHAVSSAWPSELRRPRDK
jgi:hypothetical protein